MIYQYDATKEACPLPLVNMRVMLKKMLKGDKCIMKIADVGSKDDIPRFLTNKGYQYNQKSLSDKVIELEIIK